MFDPTTGPVVQAIHLEKYKLGLRRELSASGVEFNLSVDKDQINELMVAILTAIITSRHIETIHYEHPWTWWDAFKLRWFPKWALKRWPARYKTVE